MDVKQVLHMNKGEGKASYAKNSGVQRNIISLGNSMIKEAVIKLLATNFPDSMVIADLGCSSGPNTFLVVSEIMEMVKATSHQMDRPLPEFQVSLNDLPGNDFNNIFVSLPAFYEKLEQEKGIRSRRCFISGVPGSFYGRLFPSKSLHFVHSSSSLHWLSKVPPALDINVSVPINKGKFYISKTSPDSVFEAYLEQFQKDFSLFLKSRSQEIVPGGRMLLSFMGRKFSDPCADFGNWYQADLLANALMSMAQDGLVEEEKIDSLNAPYYTPCLAEIGSVVEKEGSFIVDRLETFEVDWVDNQNDDNINTVEKLSSGEMVAKAVRSVLESLFESQFGGEIMDELFKRYSQLVDDLLCKSNPNPKLTNLLISLVRKE